MRSIPVVDITATAFAPYGDLLDTPATPPRQDRAARIENRRPGAAANLALVRSEPFAEGTPICRMERHAHASQTFLPLSVGAYLVMVAPDRDDAPDETRIRSFRVPGHVGLNYHAGAWHAHMVTLHTPGTFAMLVHEDGTAEDCTFAAIAPITLDLSALSLGD